MYSCVMITGWSACVFFYGAAVWGLLDIYWVQKMKFKASTCAKIVFAWKCFRSSVLNMKPFELHFNMKCAIKLVLSLLLSLS